MAVIDASPYSLERECTPLGQHAVEIEQDRIGSPGDSVMTRGVSGTMF